MNEPSAFGLLHEKVQRWVWDQNWSALRDIQERAIAPVIEAKSDIIISAATAAGKTEAAFLPACSKLMQEPSESIGILYLSPLKALINDQYRRLQSLCETLDLPLTPWHGDVALSAKNKQFRDPNGIILITPESLESLLLNRMTWAQTAFQCLRYVIIDEFHYFLDSVRGRQLQSLLHRLEFLIGNAVPRIALSATLGDMKQVKKELRQFAPIPCELIESAGQGSDLKVQIRGYKNPLKSDDSQPSTSERIVDDLFRLLRGKSNLIFANSRRRTEEIASSLSKHCSKGYVPNEFLPHHGNLSKDIREDLEKRLQEGKFPTTAVCTNTLELGIDIGRVDSVAQVTAPQSVASLRQRLGRSGRRGEASILRMFITENELTDNSHLNDRLRLETFQCVAMVNLLLKKWNEPSDTGQYHFSTLIQQVMSAVGAYGGIRADQLWNLLCKSGPFQNVDQKMFAKLLQSMGEQKLLSQTRDGLLILGVRGERMIEHFSFYAAFSAPEEFRLEYAGKPLGTIPVAYPVGRLIIFAGKYWEVAEVAKDEKRISLKPASGGQPPMFAPSGYPNIHDAIRQEMYRLFSSEEVPIFCDKATLTHFTEGCRTFKDLGMKSKPMLQMGTTVYMLPWLGDKIVSTVTLMLHIAGLKANCYGGIIDVQKTDIALCREAIRNILASPPPQGWELALKIQNTIEEKHDSVVPKELRDLNYAAKNFDIDGAWRWLSSLDLSVD